MRTTARLTLMLLLTVLTAIVAGCGSEDDSTAKTSGADRAASATTDDPETGELVASIDAKLEIKLEHVNGKDFQGIPVPARIACTRSSPATCQGTLGCPAAEDAPKDAELCDWLASVGKKVLLTKVDTAMACTQQYGGPEVATVIGTIGEEPVHATFSREDGCAIGRFDEASPLWTGEVPDATVPVGGGGAAAGSCAALDPDTPESSSDPDPAAGAADEVCVSPANPAPPQSPPPGEPEIISDPPEAFEFEQ